MSARHILSGYIFIVYILPINVMSCKKCTISYFINIIILIPKMFIIDLLNLILILCKLNFSLLLHKTDQKHIANSHTY